MERHIAVAGYSLHPGCPSDCASLRYRQLSGGGQDQNGHTFFYNISFLNPGLREEHNRSSRYLEISREKIFSVALRDKPFIV